jgi:hypothetical protein
MSSTCCGDLSASFTIVPRGWISATASEVVVFSGGGVD